MSGEFLKVKKEVEEYASMLLPFFQRIDQVNSYKMDEQLLIRLANITANGYNVMFYRYDLKYEWFLDDQAQDSSEEGGGEESPDAAMAEADDIILLS